MIKKSGPELRITEETTLPTLTGSSGSGNRRLGRITKTIEKFDSSPTPRIPRTLRTKTCPGVLKTFMKSGSSIMKTMRSTFSEAREKTLQPMSLRQQGEEVHHGRARDIYLLKMEKEYIKAEHGIYIY